MTIFKTQVKKVEKPINGFVAVPQTQSETAVVDKKKAVPTPPPVGVVLAARRRARLTHHCLILSVLLLLAIGVIGGIYMYRHFMSKPYLATCGLPYEPTSRLQRAHGLRRAYLEEQVEIDRAGLYERLEVPDFDDCNRAVVLHEFVKNLTAIVDKSAGHCFIMPLNRREVRPPKDFWDLISKLRSGYYMPDSRIVRHYYKVEKPAVRDPEIFGPYIANECYMLDTFRLKKRKRMESEHRRRFFISERFERKKNRQGKKEPSPYNYGYFSGVLDERHTGLIVEQEISL